MTDPEHPYTLEQLNVVGEDLIEADDLGSNVRYGLLSGSHDWVAEVDGTPSFKGDGAAVL